MNGTRNLKLNSDNKVNDNMFTMLMMLEVTHPTQQDNTNKDNQSTISGITVEYTRGKGMIQADNNEQDNQSTILGTTIEPTKDKGNNHTDTPEDQDFQKDGRTPWNRTRTIFLGGAAQYQEEK
eukprot:10274782-Ditylum_brightwellii.AAC.1